MNTDNNGKRSAGHLKHAEITEQIIGAAMQVHNALGYGFLEKVYENALAVELRKAGLEGASQQPIQVFYGGELVGDYVADMVVADKVVVEIKAVQKLARAHEAQLVNYLKATAIEVGLLLNFGNSLEVKRKVFDR